MRMKSPTSFGNTVPRSITEVIGRHLLRTAVQIEQKMLWKVSDCPCLAAFAKVFTILLEQRFACYPMVYCFWNFLKVDAFIRYKSPRLRVIATYSLLSVEGFTLSGLNLSLSRLSRSSVKITQAESTVSPLEYDQLRAGNEYFPASRNTSLIIRLSSKTEDGSFSYLLFLQFRDNAYLGTMPRQR